MLNERARALALLGGEYHDFRAFSDWARPRFAAAGIELSASFELADLERLAARRAQLVVLYTCFDAARVPGLAASEVAGLRDFLRRGGALLAVHSATVSAAAQPELAALLGGAFAEHPPKGPIRVWPAAPEHPSTRGIGEFELADELYRHREAPRGSVHLLASDAKGQAPVAWSRREGRGRVYYVALGHDEDAWGSSAYERLLLQAARWLLQPEP